MCGAYLSVLDSDRRLADHFGGKVRVLVRTMFAFAYPVFQMHLGYHELRNLLQKFKEEREKRRAAGAPAASGGPPGSGARPGDRGGDYRKDEYRDRDRGYDRDRHNSRHDRRERERSRSPGRRRY